MPARAPGFFITDSTAVEITVSPAIKTSTGVAHGV
jgi:hypothetical protein